MSNKKITFAELTSHISPPMLALVDDFVSGYIAQRQGLTLEQARAAVESNPDVRASFERKMTRVIALLAGPAGFQLGKKQHQPKAPKADGVSMADVAAMLAGITKPQQPGTGAA
ncbi:hypothetical protein [Tardiphaga sp. 862_B3_N1_1]|uniref:hypothetical protein n=1 Tax=Tardiphaga sp. 862_B3_N1_1 TaxID=3240763 RepID=UPI003F89C812